jgi:hypothetical protein
MGDDILFWAKKFTFFLNSFFCYLNVEFFLHVGL